MSWSVWLIEKEFGIVIHDDFPVMKMFMYMEEFHLKRYESLYKNGSSPTSALTMGK